MAGTNVSFDGNSIQTANIRVNNIAGHEALPNKDAKLYALAHANKSSVPYVQYPSRNIKISGQIEGSSISDLDTRLDAFKAFFIGTEKNLDIDYAGSTRRFTATLNGSAIDRPGGLLYANFTLDFECSQPFGQATSSNSLLSQTARTLSGYTDVLAFLGNAPYQLPVITITLTAVTGGTGYLQVTNNSNGQGILITGQTFANGDVIVIDSVNKTVTKNGAAINFAGAFPEFPSGNGSLSYSDGFTTRTFNITVTQTPLYL